MEKSSGKSLFCFCFLSEISKNLTEKKKKKKKTNKDLLVGSKKLLVLK